MYTDEERQTMRTRLAKATGGAKKVLKRGDRITVTKCPGTKRWIVFDHWRGDEIVSTSGRGEYAAINISRLNGRTVDFNA